MANLLHYEELEAAVDKVTASYNGKAIDNLESAALPNRRAVIEALNHLKPAIYMGFFSTRTLNHGNLRYALSERLYPAYEILVEQIRRAIEWERACCRPLPDDASWPEKVVLEFFHKLPALREVLNEDAVNAANCDPAAKGVEDVIFSYPALQAITTYRIAHELYVQNVPMIPRMLTEHAHGKTGIDIHPGARIGRKFFIDHGTGTVIGETAVIGDNVKLYQGVTLGAISVAAHAADSQRNVKRHPTIEDDVTIYSGATVLGGNTVIGKGSVIGGNVWVTESVPPYSKVTYNGRRAATKTSALQNHAEIGGSI